MREFFSDTDKLEKLVLDENPIREVTTEVVTTFDKITGKKSVKKKSAQQTYVEYVRLQQQTQKAVGDKAVSGMYKEIAGELVKRNDWNCIPRFKKVMLRKALLEYGSAPGSAKQEVINKLKGLFGKGGFGDQSCEGGQSTTTTGGATYQSTLTVTTARLLKKTWETNQIGKLDQKDPRCRIENIYTPAAQEFLANSNLSQPQITSFMNLMDNEAPEVPYLLTFVRRDLVNNKTPFGTYKMHKRLTLKQMELLGKKTKELDGNNAFWETYVWKLQQVHADDLIKNLDARTKFLGKLKKFIEDKEQTAKCSGLRALILYNYMHHMERTTGKYDKATLIKYLAIPRERGYNRTVLPNLLKKAPLCPKDYVIKDLPCLHAIGDDAPFVTRALADFFRSATENWNKWLNVLDKSWARTLYTQTRLMSRQGNEMELKKALYEERGKYAYGDLRDMVEISICPDNELNYEAKDRVEVDLFIKNVKDLQVDVFELNALQYYKACGKEFDLDLVLDGLAPTDSRQVNVKQPDTICRMRHTIRLAAIGARSGVWLVEFVGNGQRARCVIRKGELSYVAKIVDVPGKGRQSEMLVLDEQSRVIKKGRVHVGGKVFDADSNGTILCSFTQDHDNNTPFVVEDGSKVGTATLHFTKFPRGNYSMKCGLYVDRESLLARQIANCIVRPSLFCDEEACSVACLTKTKLTLTCKTATGEVLTKVVSPELTDSREYVHELTIPNELRSLTMKLEATVLKGGDGEALKLENEETFKVNMVDDTPCLGDLHLIPRGASGYVLAAYGKNGEPYQNQVVKIKLDHRYFQNDLKHTLETNEEGLVYLGRLPDVKKIYAKAVGGQMFPEEHSWELLEDKVNVPDVVNVAEKSKGKSDIVRIPFMSADPKGPKVDVYDTKYIQKFKNVSYKDGYIEIKNLPVGDFVAHLRDIQDLDVRIAVGGGTRHACGGVEHMVSSSRVVELSEDMPLQITHVKGNRDKGYRVQLQGINENTRVHILSTYLVPRYTSFSSLASPMVRPSVADVDDLWNQFGTQQNLAEEFIYVSTRRDNLEARGREKLGVQLPTASVLQTKSTQRNPIKPLPRPERPPPVIAPPESRQRQRYDRKARKVLGSEDKRTADSSNLEWLSAPSSVLPNETPDAQGWVTIPMSSVMSAQNLLQIIATDDNNISLRNVILPTTPTGGQFKDCRLNNPLNPKQHLAEIREIVIKQTGDTELFDDWETSHIETVDDVSDVFELFLAILGHRSERERATLADYHALTVWNELNKAEKLEFYGAKKCHEVNFWLYRKDPDFFKSVILPLLKTKVQKDCMDHWLLGNKKELEVYREQKWHTLNCFERILVDATVPGPNAEKNFTEMIHESDSMPKSISRLDKLFRLTMESKNLARSREDALTAQIDEAAKVPKVPTFDITQIFEEARYSNVAWEDTTKELITPNDFWVDVATWYRQGAKGKFLSKNYGIADRNVTEMLLCMALLDLDYRNVVEPLGYKMLYAGNQSAHSAGQPVKVQFRTPTILLVKQLKERDWKSSALAVSTNYFDPKAFKEVVHGEAEDKFLDPNKMHTQKVYGCRVVVTNVSSQTYEVEVLTQIPQGAIPVRGGHKTRNQIVALKPFDTTVVTYYFYFPTSGRFGHWPAHVNSNGKILGFDLKPVPLTVVDPRVYEDKESFAYHAKTAEFGELAQYLRSNKELPKYNLSLLAPRCQNVKHFKEITTVLRLRHLYNPDVWRQAFNFGPACREEIEEFLNMDPLFQEYMYPAFGSPMRMDIKRPLGAYDPFIRKHASYKEFWTGSGVPGKNSKYVALRPDVKGFKEVYHNFLLTSLWRSNCLGSMSPSDRMMATYFLIMMNKIAEAQRVFETIPSIKKNQLYDYMASYLSIHNAEGMMGLNAQVQKYLEAKNLGPKLRKKWNDMAQFLAELKDCEAFSGEFVYESKEERRKRLEKILRIEDDGQHILCHKNLSKVTIKVYKIDIELMFSTAPFTRSNKSYRYVEPTQVFEKDLPAGKGVVETPLNSLLNLNSEQGENYLFEVISEKFCVTDVMYINDFYIQKSDRQIRVLRKKDDTPVVKAYVKMYAQNCEEDEGVFYKDGYTDLRGRFDYYTLCSNAITGVYRFAILVKTISNGSDVLYLQPAKPKLL